MGSSVITFLALLFMMALLGLYNLGFAKLQMLHDLRFSETVSFSMDCQAR